MHNVVESNFHYKKCQQPYVKQQLNHQVTVWTIISVADAGEVEEGNVFRNKETLKLRMSLYALHKMFEYLIVRSDKKEYVVKCSQEECAWIYRSSRLGTTEIFKIRKLIKGHTCSSNVVLGSHGQETSSVVASCIKYKYNSSRTIYTSNDIRNDMLHTYGVSLNYVKAWRSREQTLKIIRGDLTESFNKVPQYFSMLEQTNPGTITSLDIDGHNKFKSYFMALGASIRGWEHCRPVIVVDSTYLNGYYGRTLFTACTKETGNSIFILAFGIWDSKNDRPWTWFLENLKKAYGEREALCFVSYRYPSIKNAIEHVYQNACHGTCSYHLLQNLKTHYGKKGHNITQAFNSAICAYTLEEFEYNMTQLDTMSKRIRGYLVMIPSKAMYRA